MRKKKIWPFILLTILLCTGIFAFIYYNAVKGKDETIENIKKQTMLRKGIAFSRDIPANTVITEDDITEVSVFGTSVASGMYLTSNKILDLESSKDKLESFTDSNGEKHDVVYHYVLSDKKDTFEKELKDEAIVGRMVKYDVSKNTLITDTVMFPKFDEPTNDERMVEFNYILLPSDAYKDDYVDIRIQFTNGEDYLVVAGKKIEKCTGNTTVFFRLTEDELMRMTSASIDAFIDDAKLYAVKYVDSSTQLFDEKIEDYIEKYKAGLETAINEARVKVIRKILVTESGDMYDKVLGADGEWYITVSAFNEIYDNTSKDNKEKIMKKALPTDQAVQDMLTDDFIAKYANMKEREAKAIREAAIEKYKEVNKNKEPATIQEALESIEKSADSKKTDKSGDSNKSKADAKINSFRKYHVLTKTPLEANYAVSQDVYKVVKNNPNILDEIKKGFDEREAANPRTSKLEDLQTQLAQYKIEKQADPYYVRPDGKTDVELEKEIQDLLKKTAENNSTIAQEQNSRRVDYINNLIKNSKSTTSKKTTTTNTEES